MTALLSKNAPEQLLPLAEKWIQEGKSFYLGPENIFSYNNKEIFYKKGENISRIYGSWYICSDNRRFPETWELSADEIDDIADTLALANPIMWAFLYITNRCNARCKMCSYHKPDSTYSKNFLSETTQTNFEIIKQRLDKVHKMGIRNCSIISNGEVLVDKNWEKMVSYAADLGFKQYFISNGFLFSEKTADFFKKINSILTAQFSLHTIRFETWEKIFGVNNKTLFKNAMNAPILAKKAGVSNVSVTMVLQDENQNELDEFIEYWKDKVDLIRIIQCRNEKNKKRLYENTDPIGICAQAHSNTLYIQPSGIIVPCCAIAHKTNELERNHYGFLNIDTDSIEKIKADFPNNYRNKNFYKFCKSCSSFYRFQSPETISFANGIEGKKRGSTITITTNYEKI